MSCVHTAAITLWAALSCLAEPQSKDTAELVAPADPERGRAFVASLLEPSSSDVEASRAEVAALRITWDEASVLLREIALNRRGGDRRDAYRKVFVEREEAWPCTLRDTIRVDLCGGPSWNTHGGERDELLVELNVGLVDDARIADLRKRVASEVEENLRKAEDAERRDSFHMPKTCSCDEALWYALLATDDWSELLLQRDAPLATGEKWPALQAAIEKLVVDPEDFDARFDALQAIAAATPYADMELLRHELWWRLFDGAGDDAQRVRTLAAMGSEFARDSDRDPGRSFAQTVRTSAVRIAASIGQPELAAEALAGIAFAYCNPDCLRNRDDRVAMEIFVHVADRFPECASWGASAYNAGLLLRRSGELRAAIEMQSRMFDSNVNDLDPGGTIMQAYRNYRHESARQISGCYEELREFGPAYEWMVKADKDYPYKSWCGNCAQSHAKSMSSAIERLEKLANEGK